MKRSVYRCRIVRDSLFNFLMNLKSFDQHKNKLFKRVIMKKLLIVEDCEKFRRMIVSMFTGYYDEIYECSDGKDAKEAYRKFKPDMVLMDIEMKEVDGLTATKNIKSDYPDAHVVVMTHIHDPEIQNKARLSGADNFLLKENILRFRKMKAIK